MNYNPPVNQEEISQRIGIFDEEPNFDEVGKEFDSYDSHSPYFFITMDVWNAHRTLSNYPKPFNND